jgi:hypothetical protein
MTADRLGFWSSVALVAVGVGYALALAAGITRHGLHEPIVDPVLAVMEVLTLLSAPAIVTLMAAIHARAAPSRKVYGLAALAFGTLCAGTTSVVHFLELTSSRPPAGGGLVWPSRLYAAELLAWDVFLGLALVCAALAFDRNGAERIQRRALWICGALCLAGTVGPAVGDMRIQWIGITGYAVVLPVVSFLLARSFARSHSPAAGAPDEHVGGRT